MKSLSGVGLGLSLVFGFLLVALLGELYYLLWWKKKSIAKRRRRRNNSNINGNGDEEEGCWKNPSSTICSLRCTAQDLCSSSSSVHEPQSSMELWLKPFRDGENLPRFLFTITEETREDLESSEDGGNIVSRSNLNDLLQILETPYLTPIGSPHYFTPPITPSSFSNTNVNDNRLIINPFSESERDAAFNRLISSPPPKFKFLRDADEKLIVNQRRKKMEETANRDRKINDDSADSVVCKEEENGPFITIIVAKSQEDEKEEQLNNVR